MKTRLIFEHQSGWVLLCEGNPNYYLEAPVNSIAIAPDGSVYRKFNTVGADGWVLICAEGGPRIGEFLEGEPLVDPRGVPIATPPQELNTPDDVSPTLGAGDEETLGTTSTSKGRGKK